MGQQQILLLVLTIIVVGVAVVIGIDIFEESAKQRHIDLMMNHAVHVASEAITWKKKESPYLGGGNSYAALATNGMQQLMMADVRLPGTFEISSATVNDLEIEGVSNDYPEVGVRVVVQGLEIVNTVIVYDGSITVP